MKKSAIFVLLAALATASAQTQEPAIGSGSMTVNVVPAGAPALPSGTEVRMKLETPISTASNKVGDSFVGRVTQDVQLDGKTVIPVGSSIEGKLVKVAEMRRFKGRPILEMRPESVTTPNGDKFVFTAVVVDTDDADVKVNNEGHIQGGGMDGRDKMELAIGAGGGAGAGALIARSGKGTLMGAAIGGGGAVIYWLTKKKSASLPAGTEVVMELSRAMMVNAASD